MTHPDSEVLAEFRAGLITGRRGARIAAHLAACDRCTARCGQLAEISVLLAAAPAPAMPDSVARRLDTVLAAEAAKGNDAERPGAEASPDRATKSRRARRGGWRPVPVRVLAPVAAVVAAAGLWLGLTHIGGPTASSSASSAAGPTGVPSAAKAAAPENGAESRPGPYAAANSPPGYKVITSRRNYLHSTLRQQLEAELAAPAAGGPAEPPTAQIKACVSLVASGSGRGAPRLVERARYQGQPAIVIVASGRGADPAWVTGPGCSATESDLLAKTTLPPGIPAP
jgi:negative regulator of sigma E activity